MIVVILRFAETVNDVTEVIEKRWHRFRVWILVIRYHLVGHSSLIPRADRVEDDLLCFLDSLNDNVALGAQYLFQSKERLNDSLDRWKWARFQHSSLTVEYRVRLFV